jgi:hypothetical protein
MSEGTAREFKPLAEGAHGDSTTPKLRVIRYEGERPTKAGDGVTHSFLIGSMNGQDGLGRFRFTLPNNGTHPGVLAAAMPQEHKDATPQDKEYGEKLLLIMATDKANSNNNPGEAEKLFENLKKQISIGVGQLYNLQDWMGPTGYKRDINVDFSELDGCEFAGTVKHNTSGPTIQADVRVSKRKILNPARQNK